MPPWHSPPNNGSTALPSNLLHVHGSPECCSDVSVSPSSIQGTNHHFYPAPTPIGAGAGPTSSHCWPDSPSGRSQELAVMQQSAPPTIRSRAKDDDNSTTHRLNWIVHKRISVALRQSRVLVAYCTKLPSRMGLSPSKGCLNQ